MSWGLLLGRAFECGSPVPTEPDRCAGSHLRGWADGPELVVGGYPGQLAQARSMYSLSSAHWRTRPLAVISQGSGTILSLVEAIMDRAHIPEPDLFSKPQS